MEKMIEKISSYHIVNNLIPGYLFLIINQHFFKINLINENIIYSLFEAYFVGIVISRFSSLVIEKTINKIWKLNKVPYDRYIVANSRDEKIEILSQDCNMYRSLCALMIIELVIKVALYFNILNIINKDVLIIFMIIMLIILFTASYIKQSKYILARLKSVYNNKQ